MPGGESIDLGLSFGFGAGATHMALAPSAACSECNGTREVSIGDFTIWCPACSVTKAA
jgi:hypothetical protein